MMRTVLSEIFTLWNNKIEVYLIHSAERGFKGINNHL